MAAGAEAFEAVEEAVGCGFCVAGAGAAATSGAAGCCAGAGGALGAGAATIGSISSSCSKSSN